MVSQLMVARYKVDNDMLETHHLKRSSARRITSDRGCKHLARASVARFPTQKPSTLPDGFTFVKFREISSRKKLRVFCGGICLGTTESVALLVSTVEWVFM